MMNVMDSLKGHKATVITRMAVIVAAILVFNCCTGPTIYHSYQTLEEAGWAKHDTLTFQLPQDSIPDTYSIKIGLRTTDDYRYTSLWLVMEQDLQKKGVFVRDTINYPITDKNGGTIGKGFSSHQQEIPVKSLSVTKEGGTTVRLFHIMKREVIPGVQDVGINVLSDSLQHLYEGR